MKATPEEFEKESPFNKYVDRYVFAEAYAEQQIKELKETKEIATELRLHVEELLEKAKQKIKELEDKIDKAKKHIRITVPGGYLMSTTYKILNKH